MGDNFYWCFLQAAGVLYSSKREEDAADLQKQAPPPSNDKANGARAFRRLCCQASRPFVFAAAVYAEEGHAESGGCGLKR